MGSCGSRPRYNNYVLTVSETAAPEASVRPLFHHRAGEHLHTVRDALLSNRRPIRGSSRRQLISLAAGGGNASPTQPVDAEEAHLVVPGVPWDDLEHETSIKVATGAFAEVKVIRHLPSGRYVAVKLIKNDPDRRAAIQREITAFGALRGCPFATHLVGTTEREDEFGLLLTYAPGGELFHHLRAVGPFNEDQVRFYASEILLALEHIHARGYIYRDLKPENVCIDPVGHVMLVDFGFAVPLNHAGRATGRYGTRSFLSPELLSPHVDERGVDESADWWAFACVLYEMLVGRAPFGSDALPKHEVYLRILSGKISLPRRLSSEARDLLRKMLHLDIDVRLRDPQAIRSHPFFASVSWDAVRERRLVPPVVPLLRAEEDVSYFTHPVVAVQRAYEAEELRRRVVVSPASTAVSPSGEGLAERHGELLAAPPEAPVSPSAFPPRPRVASHPSSASTPLKASSGEGGEEIRRRRAGVEAAHRSSPRPVLPRTGSRRAVLLGQSTRNMQLEPPRAGGSSRNLLADAREHSLRHINTENRAAHPTLRRNRSARNMAQQDGREGDG